LLRAFVKSARKPFTKEIERAVSILGYRPDILVLDPHDLDDILVSVIDIAEHVNRLKKGRELVASLQKRIDHITAKSAASVRRGVVVLTATLFMVESMTSMAYAATACASTTVCAFAEFGCAIAFAFGLTVSAGC
jgi:hypothetical protein